MKNIDLKLYQKTPVVNVHDNRGLTIRNIDFHRTTANGDTDIRITRHQYNAHGHLNQSIDPRLYEAKKTNRAIKPNFLWQYDLTGNTLRTESIDAGRTVTLNDIEDRPLLTVTATGVIQTRQYEISSLPGRLLSVTEQAPEEKTSRITERLIWAGNTEAEKDHNLAGQCVRHYDTAGVTRLESLSLTGTVLSQSSQLLIDTQKANWTGDNETVWQNRLAGDIYTTLSTFDATGALLTQTDAKGNIQRLAYDVAGQLSGSWLTLKGQTEQVIIKSLTYSAAGQKLREEHGNGVITEYSYEPETQRLIGIKTRRPSDAKVLQDLRYEYDPVGNVISIRNDAEATRFWHNQKVVPENTYTYDSLYQLISATGREMANIGQQSNHFPSPALPSDNNTYTNYTRTYTYDRGGNLTKIQHSSPATQNNYTTDITVSNRSNRAVLSTLTEDPAQVDASFDAGGHQNTLMPGQNLNWNTRGELQHVTLVKRDKGANDDREWYRYSGDGRRILKVNEQRASNNTQILRITYLPSLELRLTQNSTTTTEDLQVITVGEAGRAQVRVLHWENGKPADISNNQLRYSYDNLIGSSQLELDSKGEIISEEEYYPYGGTALWAARNQTEASYKTLRYSGKERDATGLYYYGYRYYQPWVGRWLSADPAGTIDGLNLYRMVRNNPVRWKDTDGRIPRDNLPPPPPPGTSNALPLPPPPPPGVAPPPPLPGIAPPPPSVGAIGGMPNLSSLTVSKTFSPIVLPVPEYIPSEMRTKRWKSAEHVDLNQLASTISEISGEKERPINLVDSTLEEVSNKTGIPFNSEILTANPAAWTSPEGIIYMATDSPDYSQNGELDIDKIRSTIIHESLHFSSHKHVGFQAETDTSVQNTNYDEYVTDYFAAQVYKKMYPNRPYKTGYFTTDVGGRFKVWGGNLVEFMTQSEHTTLDSIKQGYFGGKMPLNKLKDKALDTWKNYSKNGRPPKI
ncbi:RHS repeat domain-containing protein [Photorhabdus sp. CRCIA-P01]|uniref:RHS repeat domain-containing protein n=1 Tax=Photorhabdus sp. CRCIA-P01 TaxID=2019570 RepID=UPI000E5A04AB|nr:RHS repeat domain-containing protein [Photorhabdus sp. CRCIA-P01]